MSADASVVPVFGPVDDDLALDAVVERARGGDHDAFGTLFLTCGPLVVRFLHRLTRSEQLAEDLTAETFLKAHRNISGFKGGGAAFRSWVMVIGRNLAFDHLGSRRHKLEQATDSPELFALASAASDVGVFAGANRDALLDALEQLQPTQREVIVGRFFQDLTIAELAAKIGRSEGAVKQLQWRGLRGLARLLREEGRS